VNYQKSLVTNPEMIIAALRKVLQYNIQRIEGAHSRDVEGVKRGAPVNELMDYWCWLLPAEFDNDLTVPLILSDETSQTVEV